MNTRRVALATGLLTGLLALAANGQRLQLNDGAVLCDTDKRICIRGTLSYEPNPRLLRLRGRVQFAPGPGQLRITLTGTTRQDYRRYAPMEIDLRGNNSEIIDFKMIPDYPDVANWAIDHIEFVANDDQ